MAFKVNDIVQIKSDLISFEFGGWSKPFLGKFGRVMKVDFMDDSCVLGDLFYDHELKNRYCNFSMRMDQKELSPTIQTSASTRGFRTKQADGRMLRDLSPDNILGMGNLSKPMRFWQHRIRNGGPHPRVFMIGQTITILSKQELGGDLYYGGIDDISGNRQYVIKNHSSSYLGGSAIISISVNSQSYSVLESETVEFYQRIAWADPEAYPSPGGFHIQNSKPSPHLASGDAQSTIHTSGQGTSIKSGVSERGSAIAGYIGKSDIRTNTTRSRKVISSNIKTIITHGGSNRGSKIQSAHL